MKATIIDSHHWETEQAGLGAKSPDGSAETCSNINTQNAFCTNNTITTYHIFFINKTFFSRN